MMFTFIRMQIFPDRCTLYFTMMSFEHVIITFKVYNLIICKLTNWMSFKLILMKSYWKITFY